MANTVFQSIGTILQSNSNYGQLHRARVSNIGSVTSVATSTSGYNTCQRFPQTFTVPTLTTVTAAFMTYARMLSSATTIQGLFLEVTGATLTVSGNSYAHNATTPTRQIYGATSSVQLTCPKTMVYISATLTATTPVLTITYKNQAGTGSRTATMTLPTGALVNSAFDINPHLQSGDTGITDITNLSISTGSAGTIKIVYLFPLFMDSNLQGIPNPLLNSQVLYPLLANDVIVPYRWGSNGTGTILWDFTLAGDT